MARHYWTRKVPALWLYQRKAVKKADYLHATAESEKNNLLKLGYNSRIAVIPNGIEVENISMKKSWKRTGKILFLSRIHVKKGLDFLIEAVAALKDRMQGYEVWIAGEGEQSYIEELKRLAGRLGIERQVCFLGGVYGDRKWQMLCEADLFVLPTHSENFGIVVAEALACGTPVITTFAYPFGKFRHRGGRSFGLRHARHHHARHAVAGTGILALRLVDKGWHNAYGTSLGSFPPKI